MSQQILEWRGEQWKVLGQARCICHWIIESLESGKRELVEKKMKKEGYNMYLQFKEGSKDRLYIDSKNKKQKHLKMVCLNLYLMERYIQRV